MVSVVQMSMRRTSSNVTVPVKGDSEHCLAESSSDAAVASFDINVPASAPTSLVVNGREFRGEIKYEVRITCGKQKFVVPLVVLPRPVSHGATLSISERVSLVSCWCFKQGTCVINVEGATDTVRAGDSCNLTLSFSGDMNAIDGVSVAGGCWVTVSSNGIGPMRKSELAQFGGVQHISGIRAGKKYNVCFLVPNDFIPAVYGSRIVVEHVVQIAINFGACSGATVRLPITFTTPLY